MITRVAVGQVRFNLPGLSADARGVALGKELLLRFATMDRVVGFLRLLSGQRCPDEVWTGMRLSLARPEGGAREVLARLGCPSTQVTDLVAGAARTAGGAVFTGVGRHFAPYRDARAPLGYDAAVVAHDEAEVALYTEDRVLALRTEGDLSLERLILRLELRRQPGGAEAAVRAAGPVCYLTARRGLGPVLLELLHRSGAEASATLCEPPRPTAFGVAQVFWLIRVVQLPPRLLGLATRTPGLGLYLPATEDLLVAAGYTHPVHLGGCRVALRGERLLLFPSPPAQVIEISPRPTFASVRDLVKLKVPPADAGMTALVPRGGGAPSIEVPLRLDTAAGGAPRPRATLVPWSQAGWLRRLCFALPPVAMRSYRVAFLRAGVLVVAPERMDGIPFGLPLEETSPGVLVPVGRVLRPALSPELLSERLGLGQGALCVFTGEGGPFRVAESQFEPLERRALARNDLPWAAPAVARRAPDGADAGDEGGPPEIENDPLGFLPLRGL